MWRLDRAAQEYLLRVGELAPGQVQLDGQQPLVVLGQPPHREAGAVDAELRGDR